MNFLEMFLENSRFEPVNYSPESGQKPICPSYEIIRICGEFAGTDKSSFFCGCSVKHVDNIGLLSGRRGEEYTRHSMCSEIEDDLCVQINVLQIPTPDISNLLEKSISSLTNEEIETVSSARKLGNDKEKILNRFKSATFNICKVHPSDNSKDNHFKPVNDPEDISDEEAINAAKLFLKALQKQTTECKQIPHGGFFGMMS